jgi:hypothetical protein
MTWRGAQGTSPPNYALHPRARAEARPVEFRFESARAAGDRERRVCRKSSVIDRGWATMYE